MIKPEDKRRNFLRLISVRAEEFVKQSNYCDQFLFLRRNTDNPAMKLVKDHIHQEQLLIQDHLFDTLRKFISVYELNEQKKWENISE